jgi:hypothetical protein
LTQNAQVTITNRQVELSIHIDLEIKRLEREAQAEIDLQIAYWLKYVTDHIAKITLESNTEIDIQITYWANYVLTVCTQLDVDA